MPRLFHVLALDPETGAVMRQEWCDDWHYALGMAAVFHVHPPTDKGFVYVDEHLIWLPGAERPTARGSIDLPAPDVPEAH